MSTNALLEKGIALHNRGELADAAVAYSQILSADPTVADAWHLSGLVAHQVGRNQQSLNCLSRAISLRDDVSAYHLNLATVLLSVDEFEHAAVAAKKCLTLDAKCASAWNVHGIAMQNLGERTAASDSYKSATRIDSGHVDAWLNLSSLHLQADAPLDCQQAAKRVLEIDPRNLIALNNLGSACRDLGELDAAIDHYRRAVEVDPNCVKTLVNLGITCQERNRFREGHDALRRALNLEPTHANAWCCTGKLHLAEANIDDAIKCFQTAYELDPTHSPAANTFLFALNLSAKLSRAEVREQHIKWANKQPRRPSVSFANCPDRSRRLRIGYVSPDFRSHAMASFTLPILQCHDSAEVEIFCYSQTDVRDDTTQLIESESDHWRSIAGLDTTTVVEAVERDEIDILVDLAGHTANNRLDVFAARAAPIQISMLGYLNTTGLSQIDYVITDSVRDPESEDQFYVESVWRLPNAGCCWLPPKDTPDVVSAPVCTSGTITFGSTHRPDKLTDETLQMWANVMAATPESRLLLFRSSFGSSPELRKRVTERLCAAGIARDRLDVRWSVDDTHFSIYNEIDILLECTPWSSGTTALEAMWMGVPVSTIYGDRPAGRPTASALTRLALPDLIAESTDTYPQIVTQLASDHQRLADLRLSLRKRMQETMADAASFVRQLESAYRQMWHRWLS